MSSQQFIPSALHTWENPRKSVDVPGFIFPGMKKFCRIRSTRCEGGKQIYLPSVLSGFANWRWITFYRLPSNIAPQAAASFIHIGL